MKFAKRINYKTFRYQTDYRFLFIKLHFEMENYIKVIEQCETMLKFTNANIFISEEKKNAASRFSYYLRKIIDAKQGKDKDIFYYKEKIESDESIPHKAWLLEKIKECNFSRKRRAV